MHVDQIIQFHLLNLIGWGTALGNILIYLTKLYCTNPLNDLKILKVGYLSNHLLDHTQMRSVECDLCVLRGE